MKLVIAGVVLLGLGVLLAAMSSLMRLDSSYAGALPGVAAMVCIPGGIAMVVGGLVDMVWRRVRKRPPPP